MGDFSMIFGQMLPSIGNPARPRPRPRGLGVCCKMSHPVSIPMTTTEETTKYLEKKVKEFVVRQKTLMGGERERREKPLDLELARTYCAPGSNVVDVSYGRCRELFLKEKEPFGFGTLMMNSEKQNAFSAIWAWARRLDELVDGVNGSHTTDEVMDRWEQRLVDIFEGRPWDLYDVALSHTVSKFPLDIQLFRDMTQGTRMDMTNKRMQSFDELYLHHIYHAGSVTLLMLVQMMGIAKNSKASLVSIYSAVVAFGAAFSLVDTLKDIGQDARLGRIYLPQDELANANLREEDIFSGKVTDRWQDFMKAQIDRARVLLDEGSKVIAELSDDVRWPMWTATLLYQQDLDAIQKNGFNIFTNEVSVGKAKRLLTLFVAYLKSIQGF